MLKNFLGALSGGGNEQQSVKLKKLADLTGIPSEVLKKELLLPEDYNEESSLDMDELRKILVYYLDVAFASSKSDQLNISLDKNL